LVEYGVQFGVDPSFILGLAQAESSMGTAPSINGGQFNIYGNSSHFTRNPATGEPMTPRAGIMPGYMTATKEAFGLISGVGYIASGLISVTRIYAVYEGKEKGWESKAQIIKDRMGSLYGNANDVRYNCDQRRRRSLADSLGVL
jgi:hypothetical protein